MDEDETIKYRDFDPRSIKFQSKDEGQIIKSLRRFGIEVEMYHEARSGILKLSALVAKVFGIEHDGSIEAPGHAVEVVSPIMRGLAGEAAVVDLFDTINSLGFKINSSCGFHVHLDGSDFADTRKLVVQRVADVDESTVKLIKEGTEVLVVRADLMKKLRHGEYPECSDEELFSIIQEEAESTGDNYLYLSKMLGYSVPDLYRHEARHTVGEVDIIVSLFEDASKVKRSDMPKLNPDDILCVMYNRNNLSRVQTLLYLHTVYGDVFASMLPKSRRQGNMYCQKLTNIFSPNQIETLTSFAELEKAWYGAKNQFDVDRHRGNKYDDSRYFTVNLHSLFSKYGTVEFRSHSPTLDSRKALYWVALNQKIMDNIVAGQITIDNLRPGVALFDIDDKIDYLLSVLGLGDDLMGYVQQRIDYFREQDKK